MTIRTARSPQGAYAGARTWSRWTTECRLVVTDITATNRADELANELMDDIETAIDRFNPDSELNQLAVGGNRVSPLLRWFLETALQAAEETDGLLDPTIGTFAPSIGTHRIPSPTAGAGSWRDIAITDTAVTLPAGIHLDLGATGKAAAADLVARRIHQSLGTGVLVSLGGDIATAGGPPRGWLIDVQDAEDDPGATVSLTPGAAIATSSTLHRRWTDREGVTRHHVMDPRTGSSADSPWRTVTVVAPNCVEANTASTTAIIHGAEAIDWLTGLGLPARLTAYDNTVTSVNGFPEEEDR